MVGHGYERNKEESHAAVSRHLSFCATSPETWWAPLKQEASDGRFHDHNSHLSQGPFDISRNSFPAKTSLIWVTAVETLMVEMTHLWRFSSLHMYLDPLMRRASRIHTLHKNHILQPKNGVTYVRTQSFPISNNVHVAKIPIILNIGTLCPSSPNN